MKKNPILKLFLLVVVLTMITSSLVSGTFAKYTTTVSATDTVTVAKWNANFNGKGTASETLTKEFNLLETMSDTGVADDLIAPGTSGSFALGYDTSGSQVARNVTITLDAKTALTDLTYLKFYSDSGMETEIIPADGVLSLIDEDFGPTVEGEGTITVYWEWPFESDGAQDIADTADGIAAKSFDVTATFTATQLDTYTPES